MKFRIQFFALLFLISCQANEKTKQGDSTALASKIDSILNEHPFNGVILITTNSTILYTKAVGFSDLENKTNINLNDQFVIGSISKQITAVLILRAYEKGKIKLDDTIDQYLTELNQPWTSVITIHHLLTHTHGIIDLNEPLEFEQGSQFHYSQLGYELLAQILEKITNKSFEELSTELFEKYDLKNTFHPNNKKYEHLVKGYEETEKGVLEYASYSLQNYAAAGSFISNATDLIKWNKKLHSGELVEKKTFNLMTTKYATRTHPIFETVEYGYGLLFKDGEQRIEIGALGYAPGFVSASYYYPKTNLNLVILENTATNLDDFRQTFIVHTKIMNLLKKTTL
jgi:D-alanyl-D-alanine carboxypeptidase